MQIVTDSGADIKLNPEAIRDLNIHVVPLNVTLEGTTYREGIDISTDDFYDLLEASNTMPTTSQPSAGEFADLYRKLGESGEEILSIHMSSGLSGTYNSALAGSRMVPEIKVTHVDTKTLSAACGWQVLAAAKAVKAGISLDAILEMLKRISDGADSIYTLKELKYLINGGRISHLKGLLASAFRIKPLIGVEKIGGTYVQHGMVRSFTKAIAGLAEFITKQHPIGTNMRVQVLHARNLEGAEMLVEHMDRLFKCEWLPIGAMSLVLGAHTGPSMVGVAYSPVSAFDGVPA
ncbi:MAG: DegV family protein [Anaerolineales bacterium]|nr:DegV family protein [Anaerolineales bacterium]